MADEKNTTAVPLHVAALDCGVKVGVGLLAIAAFGGCMAWTIDHWPGIVFAWDELLRAAALGGQSFWFAAAGGIAAIAGAAWGVCVNLKVDGGLSKAMNVVGALTCIVVWYVFFRAAATTFGDLSDLSPYKAAAFALMCTPWLGLVLCAVSVMGVLLSEIR